MKKRIGRRRISRTKRNGKVRRGKMKMETNRENESKYQNRNRKEHDRSAVGIERAEEDRGVKW